LFALSAILEAMPALPVVRIVVGGDTRRPRSHECNGHAR